jgi:hypothetical protein
MSRHTPGPWRVSDLDPRVIGPVRMLRAGDSSQVPQPQAVARVMDRTGESDANARLIAAAPELLDALRAFCGDYESTPTTSDTSLKAAYLHALEIIAKAEGR